VAKVKKTYNLDERSAAMITEFSDALHMSASAFVSMMATQIGQVVTSLEKPSVVDEVNRRLAESCEKVEVGEKESGAGNSGCD
jgi:hypothetical protein